VHEPTQRTSPNITNASSASTSVSNMPSPWSKNSFPPLHDRAAYHAAHNMKPSQRHARLLIEVLSPLTLPPHMV